MPKNTPQILVSNDDGFFSKGIQALARVAAEFGRVVDAVPHCTPYRRRCSPSAPR